MRILFFNNEHYVPFEQESQNFLARLPIIHCGLDITYRDHVHQRDLRELGREAALRNAFDAVVEFSPDVIVYYQCWNDEDLPRVFFETVRAKGIKVITFIWDSNVYAHETEIELFTSCDCLVVVDSIDSYLRWRLLTRLFGFDTHISLGMGYYYYDGPRGLDGDMLWDVTLLGSIEGHRLDLLNFLTPALAERGIRFFKGGGCLDTTAGASGFDNTWLSWDDYTRVIRKSKVCLSSQSSVNRTQIKGKIFEILGRGAFCLADENDESRRMFPAGTVPLYKDFQDCLAQITYFVENDSERERRRAASVEWFDKQFDWRDYFSKLLNYVVHNVGEAPSRPFLDEELQFAWDERKTLLPVAADATTGLIKLLTRTQAWPARKDLE